MGYHPSLGRWIERDPLPYSDGMNPYEYAKSMSPILVDPLGTASLLPPGFEKASPGVFRALTGPVEPGCTRQNDARTTQFGDFRAVAVAGRAPIGQMTASIYMDFQPNEETKRCCDDINIIQQMHMMFGGNPVFSGDWSSPPDGKTQTPGTVGQAQNWATKDGRYIERSHTVNTPFMAGTVNEGGRVTGRPGLGGDSLYWEDVPHTPPDITPGGPKSKIEVVVCAICKKGRGANASAWNGKVLACYRYGVVYTPKPAGPEVAGQRSTATYEPLPLTFSESMPPDMMESIGAWNSYVDKTQNGWPKINLAG